MDDLINNGNNATLMSAVKLTKGHRKTAKIIN